MVRLKERGTYPSRPVVIFQFHYGTIKSALPLLDYVTSGVFQFHYGTIKSGKQYPFGGCNTLFQFHYGTIKRKSE